ncbi:MAG: hypothetical protein H3C36_12935, partial [Chitinophagaceae bacterium]|nr:hypothetical protein [Chitinophagaceae bacterium]
REARKREEPSLSTIDKPGTEQIHNTQAAIAKDLGWSTGKTAMAEVVFFVMRNLTDGWKFELAQVKRELLQEIGRERKVEAALVREAKKRGEEPELSIVDNSGTEQIHNTRDTIAKDLGWSTGKTAYGRGGFFVMQR